METKKVEVVMLPTDDKSHINLNKHNKLLFKMIEQNILKWWD